ncbi:hypothetical protein ACVXG7_24440 [Enterobacter hormaechei]
MPLMFSIQDGAHWAGILLKERVTTCRYLSWTVMSNAAPNLKPLLLF